jgi:leucyl-tRNA---protein transferase
MTSMNDLPLNKLQFYSTGPYPCSYLPKQDARSQVATPAHVIDTRVYSRLVESGFRRSGSFTYRPHCERCKACIPVRIDVAQFLPNRTQRRVWKKHGNLVATPLPLRFLPEHYELYQRYQSARHNSGGMDEDSQEQYSHFLLQSNVRSYMVEFRENAVLKMVSIIDELQEGLSSVYTFFEPEEKNASYGVYNVLWQIDSCLKSGLTHLYLGYLIHECRKMSYKAQFKALEGFREGRWRPILSKPIPSSPSNTHPETEPTESV